MEEKKVEHHHITHHTDIPVTHVKKRIDWTKVLIAVGILAVIVLGGLWISSIAKAKPIATGDTLKFNFDLKFSDGERITNESEFVVGSIAQTFGFVSDKLDQELGNLALGEEKTITLSAKDAYGEYNSSLLIIENRTNIIANRSLQEINKTFDIPTGAFLQVYGENATLNKAYKSNSAVIWDTKVIGISSDSVKMSIENKALENVTLNQVMFVEIIEVTSDKLKVKLNAIPQTIPSETGNSTIFIDGNDIKVTSTPIIGSEVPYGYSMVKVVSYNDTSVVFDSNNPYAGKDVTVTLTATKIVKQVAANNPSSSSTAKKVEGAPTLQAFVMTHCPYGTQMEKGVIPAMKLLAGKANFEIRFVSYTMHGAKEDTETKRQLCIREETDKFWTYLECFLEDESYASKCMDDAGIDSANIDECMSSRAEDYWAADKELNTQYGVQGSPTTILNGEDTQIYPRSPEDVKKAVCAAFVTQPSECSQTLDANNPSAGFGFGSSSSGSAASCG